MSITVNPLTFVISVPKADLTFVSGTLYKHNTDAFRLELKNWEDTVDGIASPKTHNHNTEVTIVGTTYFRAINMLAPYSIEYENGLYSVILEGSNNNMWDIEGGILVQNSVQVIPTNTAGGQVVRVETGTSGLTTAESNALMQNTADLSAIQVDVASVESNIGSIESNITAIEGNITVITSDIAAINGDISTVQLDISDIKNSIISIETDIGTIEIDISTIQVDLAFMKAIEEGEWKIENDQMIFYNDLSVEIKRFNLFDGNGTPTMLNVFRRVPV